MRFLLIGTLTCLTLSLSAQVLNPDIRFLWVINDAFANFNDEPFEDEYTMLFLFSDGTNIGRTCVGFEGETSGYYDGSGLGLSQNNWEFGANFTMTLQAWEDDGGERCDYDDGDDALYVGATSISGGTISGTGGPSRWLTNTGNQGVPCVGDAMFPNQSNWNFCYSIQWRHLNGNNSASPLRFNSNFSSGAKSHFNSNITGEFTESYSNDYGEPSADVHYTFTLDRAYPNVDITTDFPDTDFDTKIYLLQDGELIEENDDIDGANNRKSRISRGLCAGTYQVIVEGFDTSTGDFRIGVDATGFTGPLEANEVFVAPTCDDTADGSVTLNASFGIEPYNYFIFNTTTGTVDEFDQTYDQLNTTDTYYTEVRDACGSIITGEAFTVAPFDNIDPVAVCVSATITLNDTVMDSEFSSNEIGQLAGQSTDNCGSIVDADIFPNFVSASDAPVFSYELIVYDAAGNSHSNLCQLNIDIVSGVAQNPALEAALTTYPNPTNGILNVSISEHSISTGQLFLRDQLGRTVASNTLSNTPANYTQRIDLTAFPAGIYTLQIQTPEGQLTRRIIKQ